MTAKFITPLRMEVVQSDDGAVASLVSSLIYRAHDGQLIVVPRGFKSDLATLPGIARLFMSKLARHAAAAVLHDYMYSSDAVPRWMADHYFREAMAADGVGRTRRAFMFWAVRVFGGFYRGKTT